MSITNKITVIIVLYNSSEIIFDCLKTLNNFEIIIVDNGKNSTVLKKLGSMNNIKIVSFTNGVGSRSMQNKIHIKLRKENSLKASKILGFKWLQQFDYPDNEMDTVSMLEIIKKIEEMALESILV